MSAVAQTTTRAIGSRHSSPRKSPTSSTRTQTSSLKKPTRSSSKTTEYRSRSTAKDKTPTTGLSDTAIRHAKLESQKKELKQLSSDSNMCISKGTTCGWSVESSPEKASGLNKPQTELNKVRNANEDQSPFPHEAMGRFEDFKGASNQISYHAPDSAGFQQWLKERYGDTDGLNAVRNDSVPRYSSLDKVDAPEMKAWKVEGLGEKKRALIESARAQNATDFEIATMLAAANIETHDMNYDPHDKNGGAKRQESRCYTIFNINATQMQSAGVLNENWKPNQFSSVTDQRLTMDDQVGAFLQTVRASGPWENLTTFDQLRQFLPEHRNGLSNTDTVDWPFEYGFL